MAGFAFGLPEILATLVLGKELNLFGVYRSTTFFAD